MAMDVFGTPNIDHIEALKTSVMDLIVFHPWPHAAQAAGLTGDVLIPSIPAPAGSDCWESPTEWNSASAISSWRFSFNCGWFIVESWSATGGECYPWLPGVARNLRCELNPATQQKLGRNLPAKSNTCGGIVVPPEIELGWFMAAPWVVRICSRSELLLYHQMGSFPVENDCACWIWVKVGFRIQATNLRQKKTSCAVTERARMIPRNHNGAKLNRMWTWLHRHEPTQPCELLIPAILTPNSCWMRLLDSLTFSNLASCSDLLVALHGSSWCLDTIHTPGLHWAAGVAPVRKENGS